MLTKKFKNDRLKNGKIYDDLEILLKYFPQFNCDLNLIFFLINFKNCILFFDAHFLTPELNSTQSYIFNPSVDRL